jgi:hypothetical protein
VRFCNEFLHALGYDAGRIAPEQRAGALKKKIPTGALLPNTEIAFITELQTPHPASS